jgi:hypothetical protein
MSSQLNAQATLIANIVSQNERIIAQNTQFLQLLVHNQTSSVDDDSTSISLSDMSLSDMSSLADESSSYQSSLTDESSSYHPSSDESTSDVTASDNSTISSSDTNSTQTKSKKRVRKIIEFEIIEQDSYTPIEISNMDDYVLTREFIRITGHNKLSCTHCKRPKSLEFWIHSIRKRCMKSKGLCATMTIPKTCDERQALNSIANPVNNIAYPLLRSDNVSQRVKELVKDKRSELFGKIGKVTHPHKY